MSQNPTPHTLNPRPPQRRSRPATASLLQRLACVGPGDRLLDIGSGDGRFCVAAVQKFGCARAVGVELDESLVRLADGLAGRCGVSVSVSFMAADFTTLGAEQLSSLASYGHCRQTASASACGAPCPGSWIPSSSPVDPDGSRVPSGLDPDGSQNPSPDPAAQAEPGGGGGGAASPDATSCHPEPGPRREAGAGPGTDGAAEAEGAGAGAGAGAGPAVFSVVVVYLLPGSEERFRLVLTRLYEGGARVVAVHFPLSPALGLRMDSGVGNLRLYSKASVAAQPTATWGAQPTATACHAATSCPVA